MPYRKSVWQFAKKTKKKKVASLDHLTTKQPISPNSPQTRPESRGAQSRQSWALSERRNAGPRVFLRSGPFSERLRVEKSTAPSAAGHLRWFNLINDSIKQLRLQTEQRPHVSVGGTARPGPPPPSRAGRCPRPPPST